MAATSATACGNVGDPLRMSGITATHETYTKPPAVAANSGCSRPAYCVASRPMAVPAKAAKAVANCAPIACHFLKPHNKSNTATQNESESSGTDKSKGACQKKNNGAYAIK